jgi:hypothetical protein
MSNFIITRKDIFRFAGLSAIIAGVIFAGIQPIHPPDILASVTTGIWKVIITLKLVMTFLFLIGIAGLYIRQSHKIGWVGLSGAILFSLSWALQSGFVFAELLILPPLAAVSPTFVTSALGLGNGHPGPMNIGIISTVYIFVGVFYLVGGILFGVSTFRAKMLPRWPAALLAVTAFVTPAAGLLPHHLQRFVAVPMGISLAFLGYALLAEKKI